MNKITTVKELPDSEKPYEKFLTYGPEYLSDAELLAVIIRSGTSGLKSVEVAQNLLNDGHRNLLNLYDIPFEKMQKIRGNLLLTVVLIPISEDTVYSKERVN